MSTQREPVLIVGAGPVGLMMALELAKLGVEFRIIEKEKKPIIMTKALGIHARTQEILKDLGLLDSFAKEGYQVPQANLYSEGKRLVTLDFKKVETPFPYVLDIPQYKTEKILNDHLNDLGYFVERPVELVSFKQDEHNIEATLQHLNGGIEQVKVPWMISCEGAHSTIRRLLGLEFKGYPYSQNFSVVDLTIDSHKYSDNSMHIIFHEDGVTALFPIGAKRYRVVCDTTKSHSPNQAITFEDFEKLLHKRIDREATFSNPEWPMDFHIHHRQVDHYMRGRVFLAGDAAHIHSPAGGQGLNTGLQDAHNLAWKLALVIQNKADPSLLDSYHQERYPVGKNVLKQSDMMTHLSTMKNSYKKMFRNCLLKSIGSSNSFKKKFTNFLSEVGINYRKSPIVSQKTNFWRLPQVKPGDRAPICELTDYLTNESISMIDLLGKGHFQLLLFSGKHHSNHDLSHIREVAAKSRSHLKDVLNVHIIACDKKSLDFLSQECPLWYDPEGKVAEKYGAYISSLFLIRPDGYISFINKPPSFESLQQHLHEKLQLTCF